MFSYSQYLFDHKLNYLVSGIFFFSFDCTLMKAEEYGDDGGWEKVRVNHIVSLNYNLKSNLIWLSKWWFEYLVWYFYIISYFYPSLSIICLLLEPKELHTKGNTFAPFMILGSFHTSFCRKLRLRLHRQEWDTFVYMKVNLPWQIIFLFIFFDFYFLFSWLCFRCRFLFWFFSLFLSYFFFRLCLLFIWSFGYFGTFLGIRFFLFVLAIRLFVFLYFWFLGLFVLFNLGLFLFGH